jgi:surface protein
MKQMFHVAKNFNQSIGNWNVSNVTTMKNMFSHASSFNQPIGDWNVANVTDMGDMFNNTSSFNQPLENWNVSNVTTMESMFNHASSFNQSLENWNVSNVTSMKYMFYLAKNFTNQDLSTWDVKKVSIHHTDFIKDAGENNIEPKWLKSSCISRKDLEEKIKNNEDVTKVDVSCINHMGKLFQNNSTFNQDISGWDVSNVTVMYGMFNNAIGFKNHDLSKWNVKKVQDHTSFFENVGENNIEPKWNN